MRDPVASSLIQQASRLQLVNNYAFTPALNDRLSLLFLELKDGTRIISLKPFLPDKFRLNDRNVSPSAASGHQVDNGTLTGRSGRLPLRRPF